MRNHERHHWSADHRLAYGLVSAASTTGYTYDAMNRIATRRDALTRTDTYTVEAKNVPPRKL